MPILERGMIKNCRLNDLKKQPNPALLRIFGAFFAFIE